MNKAPDILMVLGFIGGLSQWLADNEPAIQAMFYIISAIVLVVGFGFKMYDRFK